MQGGNRDKLQFRNRMSEAAVSLERSLEVRHPTIRRPPGSRGGCSLTPPYPHPPPLQTKEKGNASFKQKDYRMAKRHYTESLEMLRRYAGAFTAAQPGNDPRIEVLLPPPPPRIPRAWALLNCVFRAGGE